MPWRAAVVCAAAAAVAQNPPVPTPPPSDGVVLATFDGAPGTGHQWGELDDPVMGGRSHGEWNVVDGKGVFSGKTVNVPSLQAPGFCEVDTCTAKNQGGIGQRPCGYVPGGPEWGQSDFPDASSYSALRLRVRSLTDYSGFLFSFAVVNQTRPAGVPKFPEQFSPPVFKAPFKVTRQGAWEDVTIPFDKFSNDWSPFDGLCSSKDPTNGYQHRCCSSEHPEVCPTKKHLASISGLYFWAEGVAGAFHLEIDSISAVNP